MRIVLDGVSRYLPPLLDYLSLPSRLVQVIDGRGHIAGPIMVACLNQYINRSRNTFSKKASVEKHLDRKVIFKDGSRTVTPSFNINIYQFTDSMNNNLGSPAYESAILNRNIDSFCSTFSSPTFCRFVHYFIMFCVFIGTAA